jgi:ribose 5-phosphate isomerase B
MRVAIGSDHAGYQLKTHLVDFLREQGHDPYDVGTHSTESVDYPDYAERIAEAMGNDHAQRAIMNCGSRVLPNIVALHPRRLRRCRVHR